MVCRIPKRSAPVSVPAPEAFSRGSARRAQEGTHAGGGTTGQWQGDGRRDGRLGDPHGSGCSFTRPCDAARLSNVSPSTVGRIEKGELDPTWGCSPASWSRQDSHLRERFMPMATPAAVARASCRSRAGRHQPQSIDVPDGAEWSAELEQWWDRWRRARWPRSPHNGHRPRGHACAHREGGPSRCRMWSATGEGGGAALRIDQAGFDAPSRDRRHLELIDGSRRFADHVSDPRWSRRS